MSTVKIDHNHAKAVLQDSVAKVVNTKADYKPISKQSKNIAEVILGTHLTYRYILFTGLLAKATNKDANPVALQAKAVLDGAYDARSLCHKVIVPEEASLLDNKLGGSNEPFLNKPARFTHLSEENAVRRGKDADALKKLIQVLSSLKSASDAKKALEDAIYYTLERPSRKKASGSFNVNSEYDESRNIYALLTAILHESHEGETCSICVSSALAMLYRLETKYTVVAHPTNQAGTSSNEICDVDVLFDGSHIYGVEVKDKSFHKHDIIHAAEKAKASGLTKILFVRGPRAKPDFDVLHAEEHKGINVSIMTTEAFLSTTLALCPPTSLNTARKIISNMAVQMRVKDRTFSWLEECFSTP